MAVLFNNIPGNIRVPFFYAEFQPGGTPYQNNARLLLVGQKLTAGNATANVPVMVRDGSEDMLFGANSMLSAMVKMALRNAPVQEIWALPVADLGGGVQATGKISVAAPSLTQATTLSVYIAGERVRIGVLTSDTRTGIAANLIAAINATPGLPVTALVNGANAYEVDLTARHKGTLGNAILIDTGVLTEDGTAGATLLTITAMASGAGDPDLQTALGSLGDDEFDWIGSPYADSTNLGRASDLLNDVNGRWSWSRQIYGHYICSKSDTVGNLSTLGNARNDQHASIFPCYKFLSPPWLVAAAVAAKAAKHLQDAPELSRPLQTLKLEGIKGPRLRSDWLTITDRQTLYYDGISGYHVRRDGSVCIDRVVTTYQSNAWGDTDWTYLDIETMAQSMYGIRYIRTDVTSKHARQALADDNPGRLPHITTPRDIKASVVHAYSKLVRIEGVFENLAAFESSLVVERDDTDANRVNVSMNLDHVNQLRVLAAAAVNWMQTSRPELVAA